MRSVQYIFGHTSRSNQSFARGKTQSLYLRHFSMSHLRPDNICACQCSTPPHHSPAAKHFLVDYSGFSLHTQCFSLSFSRSLAHTHTRRQMQTHGIKKGVRHSNHFHSYYCLRMWQNLKLKHNVRWPEPADIPGWAWLYFWRLFFWVLLYEWTLYMCIYIHILQPVIILHTWWERLSGKLVPALQAEPKLQHVYMGSTFFSSLV